MGPPSLRWTLIQRHMTHVQVRRTVFMTTNPTTWYQGGVSLAKDAREPQSTNTRSTSWAQNRAFLKMMQSTNPTSWGNQSTPTCP